MACSNLAQQDVLECKICKNSVIDPQTLTQCLHSFCKTCLQKLPKKDRNNQTGFFCPECDEFTKDDELDEITFLNDLKILTIKGAKGSGQITCKQCKPKEVTALWQCSECKIEICDECKNIHLNIPMLKDHKITGVELDSASNAIDKLLFCKIHYSKPIEFNCKICEVPICSMCTSSFHNGHTIETVQEALQRLQPDIVADSTTLHSHIGQIKAQLGATKVKINQTKETYASCRMKMDERCAKVINNLKAMKAKMEDEVTEQEIIALNILEKVEHSLECKLRKASNLTNLKLVSVTTDKIKNASLLDVLQTGLHKKTKKMSQDRPENVLFEINVPSLHFKLKEEQHPIAEISYYVSRESIDVTGGIWRDHQFMCEDFMHTFSKKLTKVETVNIGKWCNRISYIDGHIIVPFGSTKIDDGIRIYDKLGKLVKKIGNTGNDRDISVIRKANNGDIIAGGTKGLYVTNNGFSEWTKISDGFYSDIAIYKDNIFALEYMNCKVVILASTALRKDTHSQWEKISEFQIGFDLKQHLTDSNSTLFIDNEILIVTLQNNLQLFKHGKLVNLNWAKSLPNLCGLDETGKLLMVDFFDGKFYIFRSLEDAALTDVQKQSCALNFNCPGVRDAVITDDNSIWVLQNNTFNLIRYAVVET